MASATTIPLVQNWRISPVAGTPSTGEDVSDPAFDDSAWTPAVVPGTVLGALTAAGRIKDPYVGRNLERIDRTRFAGSWWFRTVFELGPEETACRVTLIAEGVNYRADVWLDGVRIARADDVFGAFRRFRFDLTPRVAAGAHALAFEVVPPRPGEFSTGFVDWNPAPPDGNMGLIRPVVLRFHGSVSVEDPWVTTELLGDGREAALTARAGLVNHTDAPVSGVWRGRIGEIRFEQAVTLGPHERREVDVGPEEAAGLLVRAPRLWWPHDLGTPHLHRLETTFEIDAEVSDRSGATFGIREVDDYFTEDGHRGFRINGRPVLIRGAGWTDDLFLMDTPATLEAQVRYARHMGLNCIRLEGFWGKDAALYDLCDRMGVLLMAGWSCHWEHESYLGVPVDARYGGVVRDDDVALIAASWEDRVTALRRHPSIFVWAVASDKQPAPELERRYVEVFRRCDPTRPYLNSTGGVGSEQGVITEARIESEISGGSGVKMLGPYAYTPPVYWFTDTRFGGAYGFNTETGPGAQPPVLESLRAMLPAGHRWPIDGVWNFHCARQGFDTLDRFVEAMTRRLGAPRDLEDFSRKAQALNYELIRPMFEAFRAHKHRSPGRATGVVHWMLNSAWPSLYWQLYGHDLIPTAAFYAVRAACRPLHLLYHLGDQGVYFVHSGRRRPPGLRADVRALRLDGSERFRRSVPFEADPDAAVRLLDVPGPAPDERVWFLDLRLLDGGGGVVDRNFYWLSAASDVLDYEARVEPWAFYTPSKGFADFSALHTLPEVALDVSAELEEAPGGRRLVVDLANPSGSVAFFVELRVVDAAAGTTVVPVFWNDNYVSLPPADRMRLAARLPRGGPIRLELEGWNVRRQTSPV